MPKTFKVFVVGIEDTELNSMLPWVRSSTQTRMNRIDCESRRNRYCEIIAGYKAKESNPPQTRVIV